MEKSAYTGLLMKTAVNCFPNFFIMGLSEYLNPKIDKMMAMRKVTRNPTHSGAILYANKYLFFELEELFKEEMNQIVKKEYGKQWIFVGITDIKF